MVEGRGFQGTLASQGQQFTFTVGITLHDQAQKEKVAYFETCCLIFIKLAFKVVGPKISTINHFN